MNYCLVSHTMPTPTIADIVSHNQRFLRQKGRLRVYAAAEATLVLGSDAGWCQLCQMGFSSDGSFHVAWPYLAVSEGIVAEVDFPANHTAGPATLSLTEKGRFTTQRVKYSHHRSGLAQFSLTGKVRNDVRRKSFPLTGPIGQLFHLQCHSPAAFKALGRLKPHRLYITFLVAGPQPADFLIRGGWHRKDAIVANIYGAGRVGPVAPYKDRRSGEEGPMTFWSPPLECPVADHIIGVLGDPVAAPTGMEEPGLVLLGGLDEHESPIGGPPAPPIRGGLAAMYPVRLSEDMRRALGTIDLDTETAG